MRSTLYLLTLIALLVAPVAAPVAAMASVQPTTTGCQHMDMGAPGHAMPAGHHRQGEACCVAVPPAIDPPVVAMDIAPAIDHPIFVAAIQVFRLGAGPKAEDPPPRVA